MRQTAVEWLQDCLTVHFSEIEHQIRFTGLFDKAKRLENELKIEMFDKGFDSNISDKKLQELQDWVNTELKLDGYEHKIISDKIETMLNQEKK